MDSIVTNGLLELEEALKKWKTPIAGTKALMHGIRNWRQRLQILDYTQRHKFSCKRLSKYHRARSLSAWLSELESCLSFYQRRTTFVPNAQKPLGFKLSDWLNGINIQSVYFATTLYSTVYYESSFEEQLRRVAYGSST
jgi:hypothetical protein